MKSVKSSTRRAILVAMTTAAFMPMSRMALASYGYSGRQYYSNWSYLPERSYYYSYYYYRPAVSSPSYNYHYCIRSPSRPRYVYYYNPVTSHYWGRLDLQGTEGAQYSVLAEKDRKSILSDIPESAFPNPGPMPKIPESSDTDVLVAPLSVPGSDVPRSE